MSSMQRFQAFFTLGVNCKLLFGRAPEVTDRQCFYRVIEDTIKDFSSIVSSADYSLMCERFSLVRALWVDLRHQIMRRKRKIESRYPGLWLDDWCCGTLHVKVKGNIRIFVFVCFSLT